MKAVRIHLAALVFCFFAACNDPGATTPTPKPSTDTSSNTGDKEPTKKEPPPEPTTHELVSIAVAPPTPSIALGTKQAFNATGIYSDNTTKDLTGSVTWASSNVGTATIATDGVATSVSVGTTVVSATFQSITGTTNLTVTAASLVSIDVTPANPSVPLGTSQNFTAMGIFSDGTTQDITGSAEWLAFDPAVGSIAAGVFQSLGLGSTSIVAKQSDIMGMAGVTVTDAVLVSLSITPTNPSIPKGLTQVFNATGVYSDTSTKDLTDQVVWSSSDAAVASIAATGIATGLTRGTTNIGASIGTNSTSTVLAVTDAQLVSIEISPLAPSVAKGKEQQFTAIGTYTDASTEDLTSAVVWETGNPAVATISNTAPTNGLVSTVGVGETEITASRLGVTHSTKISVTSATLTSISVTPYTETIALGLQVSYKATGTYSDNSTEDLTEQVLWTSSLPSVARISNTPGTIGVATSLSIGATYIYAVLGAISGAATLQVNAAVLTSISVTPSGTSIAKGLSQQFTAIGAYSDTTTEDITSQVTWSSSNETVASISNAVGSQGLATGTGVGDTSVSAQLSGVTGSAPLTVTSANLVSITVSPTKPSAAKGTTIQFSAWGIYSDDTNEDLTERVTWTSNDETIASVSNADGSRGLASALSHGSTAIFASLSGVDGYTDLNVTNAVLNAIQISADSYSVSLGLGERFRAEGIYSDGSTQTLTTEVTWSSSNPLIASISNANGTEGQLSTHSVGTVWISAAFGGLSDSAEFEVKNAALVSMIVTPGSVSVPKGLTQQFTATGTFSDGSTGDVTSSVTWTTSSPSVASISNTSGSQGLATTLTTGTATMTAASGAITATASLTVTSALLQSITISPASVTMPVGVTRQFSATGTYSDGSTQNITSDVTWSSTNNSVATISNSSGSNGLATSASVGSVTVRAALGSISASASLTVNTATLQSITITPANPTINKGATIQLTATGNYSDGSTQNLTSSVSWSSSKASVASVNAGSVKGKKAGTTTITATKSAISGSTVVTVR